MLNVSVEVGRHSVPFPVTVGEHELENNLVTGRSIRSSYGSVVLTKNTYFYFYLLLVSVPSFSSSWHTVDNNLSTFFNTQWIGARFTDYTYSSVDCNRVLMCHPCAHFLLRLETCMSQSLTASGRASSQIVPVVQQISLHLGMSRP